MTSNRTSAATRRPARIGVEQLEDRSVPATFTSAGFTFEQLSTPDNQSLLGQATYDAAAVNVTPTTATGTVTGFPDSTTGFNANLALGTLVDATNPPKALVLGGAGATDRSGVLLSWTGGKGLVNVAGDDLVIYETEPGTTATAKPEAFMVEVHNATTNTWSNWYYEPPVSVAAVTDIGGSAGVVFATALDFSNLGLAANAVVDQVRIVNMTSADRMANASGVGRVLPGDNGTTSTNLPSAGTFGTLGGFTPEILYVGTDNTLSNPLVDVTVTKTDNATTVAPGATVTYTIVVSNSGPNAATGTTLTDTLPTSLTGVTWTSSTSTGVTGNTATGSGNINETLSLPANSSVTYTVTGTLSPSATGALFNTATATVAGTLTDADNSDNTATDTTTITGGGSADLSITKTDNLKFVVRGLPTTYTITVTNVGSTAVAGARVLDNVSSELTGVSWTAAVSGGATVAATSGTGSINQLVNLPAGASVTYSLTGTVTTAARGGLTNTATVNVPVGVSDTNPSNNTASDRDTVLPKPVPAFLHQFAMGVGNTGLVALFNNDGTLRTVLNPSLGLGGIAKAVMGDLNGDGMEDVVITMLTGPLKGLVEVLDGVTLTPLQVFFPIPIPGLPVDVAVGDVNGDGFLDLVFSTTSGLPVVFAKDFVTGELLTLFSPINIPLPAFSISTINVDNDGPDEIALSIPVAGQTVVAIFNTASQLVGIRVI